MEIKKGVTVEELVLGKKRPNRAVHARNKESAKGQMEMASSWRIKKE